MAHLIQPLINVGGSPPTQETHQSTRHSSSFIQDAPVPFDYPKRIFNSFPLRDLPDLTVIDGVGKQNERTLVCRFPWRSKRIKYPSFSPSYKKKRRELFHSYLNHFNLPKI